MIVGILATPFQSYFSRNQGNKFVGAEPFIMSVSFLGRLPFLGGSGMMGVSGHVGCPPGENGLQSRRSYQQGWGRSIVG